MPSHSRRHVLASLAALLAGVSGCTKVEETGRTPTPVATEREFPHSVRAPATRKIRRPGGEPAVRSSVVDPLPNWTRVGWAVTSPSERDALEFSPAATGVDAATAFVDDVDLSTETVLVHQYTVEECLTRQLERLEWGKVTADGPEQSAVRLEYDATERDVDCEHDAPDDVEATFVLVPDRVERIGRFTSLVGY